MQENSLPIFIFEEAKEAKIWWNPQVQGRTKSLALSDRGSHCTQEEWLKEHRDTSRNLVEISCNITTSSCSFDCFSFLFTLSPALGAFLKPKWASHFSMKDAQTDSLAWFVHCVCVCERERGVQGIILHVTSWSSIIIVSLSL